MAEASGNGSARELQPQQIDVRSLEEPLAGVSCSDEALYLRGVKTLSFGFLGVFGGFQAAQGLQTSLNAKLGQWNLACLYGTFTLVCLVAPPLLSTFERYLGMGRSLLLFALAYATMALSNVIAMPSDFTALWLIPMAVNCLVGIAAPLLWTGQNIYVSRCATRAASLQVDGVEGLQQCQSLMTTKYNSLFFSIYQFAGLLGNILASVILLAFNSNGAKSILFVTLGAITAIGALIFLTMPTVSEMTSDTSNEAQSSSLVATARLAFTDPKVGLLIPLMVFNGMSLGFFIGDFPTDVTCPIAGPGLTGFALAAFFGVNSLASFIWGKLISNGILSRRSAYILATMLLAIFLLVKQFWEVPQNFVRASGSTTWTRIKQTEPIDYVMIFALAAIFGGGDSFFEAGPPMTLQTFYAGSDKVVAAMANYKLWQSLGIALQFLIDLPLGNAPKVKGAILLVTLGFALFCVLVLDRFFARVDGIPGRE